MEKATVRDVDVAGKTVLVRADLNVPMKNGVVGDATLGGRDVQHFSRGFDGEERVAGTKRARDGVGDG